MEINIEKIMEEIRSEIREKGYTADMLSFSEVTSATVTDEDVFNHDAFVPILNYLNRAYEIQPNRPLGGNGFFVFIKKVIRKLTRFYVQPIVEAQNEYNAFTVRALNMIDVYIRNQEGKSSLADMEKKIELMQLQVKTLSEKNKALEEKIASFDKGNDTK